LLLDGERPKMKQWLSVGRDIEVADLVEQDEVDYEGGCPCDVLSELPQLVRKKKTATQKVDRDQHHNQCAKDAPAPSPIEGRKRKAALAKFGGKETRDREA